MQRMEAVLDLDRVAGPIDGGGLAQERAAAAVEHAADDLVVRIVVRGVGIFVEVKAGEAADAGLVGFVVGIRKALQVEDGEPFAVVQPVEHHGEFFVVHSVAREGNVPRLGLGVLPQVAFPTFFVHFENAVGGAQRVQDGPVAQVFDRVVGTVVAAPALDALQVAALVEVLVEEDLAGGGVFAQKFPLEHGPGGRSHGRFDGDTRVGGGSRVGGHGGKDQGTGGEEQAGRAGGYEGTERFSQISFIDEAAWRISINRRVRTRGRRIREVGIQFLPVGWRNLFSTYNFAGGVANTKFRTRRRARRAENGAAWERFGKSGATTGAIGDEAAENYQCGRPDGNQGRSRFGVIIVSLCACRSELFKVNFTGDFNGGCPTGGGETSCEKRTFFWVRQGGWADFFWVDAKKVVSVFLRPTWW